MTVKCSKFLRLGPVEEITGLSKGTIYRLMREGKFPAAVQLGARVVGWPDNEIEKWKADRIAASQDAVRAAADRRARDPMARARARQSENRAA